MDSLEYYEHGYRLADGTEAWEQDYGTDGSWTPPITRLGINVVDIYDGQAVRSICRELDRAEIAEYDVLRRRVVETRHDAEVVASSRSRSIAGGGD